nr:cell wall hydrolase [Sphingorhabdus profundilacus]
MRFCVFLNRFKIAFFVSALLCASPVLAQAAGNESGAAFTDSPDDLERATRCLSLAIAYEAGFEPVEGQQAVAEVILNRTRHPAYPKSVCGVVFQGSSRKTGCQFTFTCDGAMKRALPANILLNSRNIANRVLAANFTPHVGGATHYHADYVSPYWAPSLIRVGKIGAHIFYRAPGSADQPARYAGGNEPMITGLGNWATAPDPLTQNTIVKRVQIPQSIEKQETFAPWGLSARP